MILNIGMPVVRTDGRSGGRCTVTTGLSSAPARRPCDNCQRMSDSDSCHSNRTHRDGLHN